ncbi:MAG: hypothetical protein HPY59_11505 [Anaerolineae bacterium]|nr:hypothetical protein [Anaerolineae bacterium]
MVSRPDVAKIELELAAAEKARRQGLEGRARVCARRAAGLAVSPFLEKQGLTVPGDVHERIVLFSNQPAISPRLRQIASHLIMRVNESYELPPEIDLIAEVRQLVKELENLSPSNHNHEQG